jgi:phytoene synthase
VDDVVDECHEAGIAARKLAWWRDEIEHTFAGNPTHPVGRALHNTLDHFNLAKEYFLEIIDGMEMDLLQTRYENFAELSLYCYRVAGVVGLLAAEIFGYEDRNTLKYAHNLGLAFQLTNILRDVKEDAQRGRIYLPQDELAQFGVSERDILELQQTPATAGLMHFQAQRARSYYDKALDLLPEADRYTQRTGLIMAAIYLTILKSIEDDSNQVLSHRISLSPLHKLWLAWRTARKEKIRHKKHHAAI